MQDLLCLPGLLCTPAVWSPALDHMGRTAQVPDLPRADRFDDLVDAMAASLTDDTVVAGMSMGSYLALALALRAPDKVRGLILIGTSAAADDDRAAGLRHKMAAIARRDGLDRLLGGIADAMLAPDRRTDAALRDAFRSMALATGAETFAAHQVALAGRPEQTDRLGRIACPVLVLTGTEDAVTPPAAGRAVAQGVADGRFVPIPGVGHMPLLECPDVVATHIADFLTNRVKENAAT
ncbi:alpha/beta fold hydrolase [Chachezhania sediminis]|uniref:alpha/beta fold hydrolase n=1 Tax=Chachezhania sediminis TaxID=2599291 RepID=UPI00131E08A8|nr:alpha/beta hydrolase [Chachezhania sediminis]